MANIKKNFFYQAFYEILIIVMPLITAPYVSRVLGAGRTGVYSFTYTMANYFVLFCALGIKNYGNREISRNRDNPETLSKTFSSILFLHFIISGIVVIAYVIYWLWIADPKHKTIVLIQGIYIITAFFDISWFYFGIEQFKMTVTRSTLIRVLTVIMIFLLVKKPSDLTIYVLILALGNFVGQMYLWLYLRRFVKIRKVSFSMIFSHLPQMSILFIPTVAISLYNYMDKIMVGKISGETELGYYENSEKLIFMATNVVGSVGTVMLPRMSNLAAKGDEKKSRQYIATSMQLVMGMACALAFGLAGIASVFAPVFWGRGFIPCDILVILLAVTLPFKGFANVLRTQYLIPHQRDKEYTISVCAGAVVNLIANFLLIRYLDAAGASVGTILAEITVCVVQMIACAKMLPLNDYMRKSMIYVISGIIMYGAVRCIGNLLPVSLMTLCIQIAAGGAVYCALCMIYFIATKNPLFFRILNGMKSKLKRRKKA